MDFGRLKYKIHEIPEGKSVIMQFPDLARYSNVFGFAGDMPPELSPDFVMRYIIYMYSPGSPLIEEIPELTKRKTRALKLLNVEPDANKKLPDHISGMIGFRYKGVVDKTVLFLRIVRNHEWSLMLAAEQKQFLLLEQMFTPKEDVQQEKQLQEAIERNIKLLRETKERFLDGEKSRELEEGVNQFLAEENLGIDPESYIPEFTEKGTVFEGVIP